MMIQKIFEEKIHVLVCSFGTDEINKNESLALLLLLNQKKCIKTQFSLQKINDSIHNYVA